ncbi:OsmC family protein [Oceanibacterium hippocampi]|uniref:OsmC-like protein n=1 Tax=Oceanibacterium hippocampi TaxID=745714 RepID=A0A1Y5TLA6_9PROT|nr:OsmC family protein [Oceanibacterium hippocampi]SLN63027.1 OsmC-like protein [Oceanibacterium hippocampi]
MNAHTQTSVAPTIVNGLNVDDLKALAASVANDTDKGHTRWRVATSWQGQTRSRSEVTGFDLDGETVERHFTIDIDEPEELGGGNRHANPQEHLLSALNACMTVGYVAQCAVRGIRLDSVEIETAGDIDLRGFFGLDPDIAPGFESLRYTVRIKGDGTPEQFREIHEAVTATSPNVHNISRAIGLRPTLIVE